MHLVLEARVLSRREQFGVVGDHVAQRFDPRTLALGEVAEHMRMHQLLHARMTDADAHALVVVADMRADRAQAVMARDAAADLHAHLGGRQIDLVVKHRDVAERHLVEMHRLGDRAAGLVHVGAGQQQQHLLAADRAFGRHALEAPPPRRKRMPLGDRLDHHESDVVAVARVLGARIAEPDEQQHGSGTAGERPGHAPHGRDRALRARALLLFRRRSGGRSSSTRSAGGSATFGRRRTGSGSSSGCSSSGGSGFGRRLHFFGVARRRHDGDQRDVAVLQHP